MQRTAIVERRLGLNSDVEDHYSTRVPAECERASVTGEDFIRRRAEPEFIVTAIRACVGSWCVYAPCLSCVHRVISASEDSQFYDLLPSLHAPSLLSYPYRCTFFLLKYLLPIV